MTPLETIRAINAACDRAHIDSDGVPLFAGMLYRTKYGKGSLSTLWYIGNGAYKFRGKSMLEARGELTKFLLGDDSAVCRDVTAGFIVYLLSWQRKTLLIGERAHAARERKLANDRSRHRISYQAWAENLLAGQVDNEEAA